MLDLLVTSASELISDIKIGGSLSCSDHALVESTVLGDMGQLKSKVRTLNFRKTKFQLLNESHNRTPLETALMGKGADQSWQIFKHPFHRPKELPVPRCKKSGKEGKKPAWLRQDLLVKLKGKEEMHRLNKLNSFILALEVMFSKLLIIRIIYDKLSPISVSFPEKFSPIPATPIWSLGSTVEILMVRGGTMATF
ncbi:hypothetical protein llap_10482 [Limosa lapponica baueri]|uniref:Rna-directed dna polymerase from mobile element jockey-like n=1 Tax=Limosa lapponica baueri TaxID=1758121 RepID=A0A2I0TZF4_LIMLA|nr:hypothetical protein llap_10482 [Limosa lapponica baueri]